MYMVPENQIPEYDEAVEIQQPSKTYGIDFKNKRVIGMVDGISALRQAVYKILDTERYDFLIYSWNYGTELSDLIGQDRLFVEAEITRRITEALKEDDRVIGIENFQSQYEGDCFFISFNVISNLGNIKIERSVRL